ncbi:MAG: ATP synthase F0 subunit B [Bryobacterales bacterium]|nr:ATP synthase F0 subunit B [Bryobacterales bacterium]
MKRLFCLSIFLTVLLVSCFAQQVPQENQHSPDTSTTASPDAAHGDAHSNEGHGSSLGGEHVDPWKAANFVILVGLLVYFLRGKVGPFFAEKNKAIARGMAGAAAKAEDAQLRLAAVEAKLAHLGTEIDALRIHAAEEMARDRERIQQETAVAMQRLQERAEGEIQSATAQAQARLRHQAAALALELAESQVKMEAAAPEMQNRLLQQAVERLGRANEVTRN